MSFLALAIYWSCYAAPRDVQPFNPLPFYHGVAKTEDDATYRAITTCERVHPACVLVECNQRTRPK